MEAGPQLDELIAEKVMGYSRVTDDCFYNQFLGEQLAEIRPYSTDIKAAWEVVNKLAHDGFDLNLACRVRTHQQQQNIYYIVGFFRPEQRAPDIFEECVHLNNAPQAICLAALKAMDKKWGK